MLCIVVSFFMYSCYIRFRDQIASNHLGKLFVNFDKACDSLEEAIEMFDRGNFLRPDRKKMKEILDTEFEVMYYISERRGDEYIIRKLPVIE